MTVKKKEVVESGLVEVVVAVDNHTHKGALVQMGGTITVATAAAEMLQKAWKVKTAAEAN